MGADDRSAEPFDREPPPSIVTIESASDPVREAIRAALLSVASSVQDKKADSTSMTVLVTGATHLAISECVRPFGVGFAMERVEDPAVAILDAVRLMQQVTDVLTRFQQAMVPPPTSPQEHFTTPVPDTREPMIFISYALSCIRRDVQLFIAVVSANTERREEGYFFREWTEAAERSRTIVRRRFIVPVVIDRDYSGDARAYRQVPDKFTELQFGAAPDGVPGRDLIDMLATEISATSQPARDCRDVRSSDL